MNATDSQQARQEDAGLEARRARRRLRYRRETSRAIEALDAAERAAPDLPLPVAPPVFEAPRGVGPGDLFSTPEGILAAARQCVHQAEEHLAAGDEAGTLAILTEASDLFAALDDFEAAALAGGAADAGRLDEVLDGLVGALEDHRL
jgi:hypothetical protein